MRKITLVITLILFYESYSQLKVGSNTLNISNNSHLEVESKSGSKIVITKDSSKVGIGTINPISKLEVIGDIKIVDGTQGNGKVMTSDATGKGSWQNISNLIISQKDSTTSSNGLSSFGKDVQLGGSLEKSTSINTTATNTLSIKGLGNGVISDSIVVIAPISNILRKISASMIGSVSEPWYISGTNIGATSNYSNIFQMGNVGIGSSNPISKLEVMGGYSTISIADSGLQTLLAFRSTIATGTVSDWKLYKGDGTGGYTQGLHLFSYPKNGASFGGCCNHSMTWHDNGKIGIGTGNPQAKLEIQGDIKIADGTQGAGKVLTSDATGKASWQTASSNNTIGDVKMGLQSNDHNGWIKMDGRSINTLNNSQKNAAISIGFSSVLPNANNSFPVQNNTTLGSISGSNSKSLIQSNLPNVQLSGSTTSAGGHSHNLTLPNRPGYCSFNSIPSFLGGDINASPSSTTTNITGDHTHNVSINLNGGVSQTNVDITPKSLSVNMFVYLGI